MPVGWICGGGGKNPCQAREWFLLQGFESSWSSWRTEEGEFRICVGCANKLTSTSVLWLWKGVEMVVDDISVLTNRNLAALQGTLEKADVVHARAWDPVVLGLTWKNVVKSYTRVVGLPSHHCQCFNGFSTFYGQIFYEAHILINLFVHSESQ